jgi:hypothetical protein
LSAKIPADCTATARRNERDNAMPGGELADRSRRAHHAPPQARRALEAAVRSESDLLQLLNEAKPPQAKAPAVVVVHATA